VKCATSPYHHPLTCDALVLPLLNRNHKIEEIEDDEDEPKIQEITEDGDGHDSTSSNAYAAPPAE
jgi:hypothetical protein